MNLKKIKDIFDGYFRKLFNQESYVKERREICKTCPYNSGNAKLSLKEKIYGLFVGGFCTVCSCNIKAKTRAPYADCGLDEIEKEPKWKSI
jgi:hypothetical protein